MTTRSLTILLAAAAISLLPFPVSGQERSVFLPKGDVSVGAQFVYLNVDSDNTNILMIARPVTAGFKVFSVSPFAQYTYHDNRTVGARVGYIHGGAAVDNITMDLLNEGLSFDVKDLDGNLRAFDAAVFHRFFFGLDARNRLGVFLETALSLTMGRTDFSSGDAGLSKAESFKLKASFSPGLMFFVMNNVSISGSLSLANVSYNYAASYENNEKVGTHRKITGKAGLDILGIWFGASFHF